MPNLSLRITKDIPPRFLMSCTQPDTVTVPSPAFTVDESLRLTVMAYASPIPYMIGAVSRACAGAYYYKVTS